MKLCIVSDSHDRSDALAQAVRAAAAEGAAAGSILGAIAGATVGSIIAATNKKPVLQINMNQEKWMKAKSALSYYLETITK